MKYSIIPTSTYKSDLKKIIKQHRNIDEVNKVINTISDGKNLMINIEIINY